MTMTPRSVSAIEREREQLMQRLQALNEEQFRAMTSNVEEAIVLKALEKTEFDISCYRDSTGSMSGRRLMLVRAQDNPPSCKGTHKWHDGMISKSGLNVDAPAERAIRQLALSMQND